MEKLPPELWLRILGLLDHQSLATSQLGSKCWKDVYATQDRGDRVGLGLKIIREGDDYYLVHLGEIQRHLGTRAPSPLNREILAEEYPNKEEEPCSGILDKILFFIGDLESASNHAKRSRIL